MKAIFTVEGILRVIDRLPSSLNGNPRFLLEVNGFVCRTAPDSGLAYSIQNYEGKKVEITAGYHYNKITLFSVKEV